ncbi:ATP-binding cassette domain-containing protein [Novosphingobium taihuense]|nr:ABC transporter ATP-binding protein [Novosphingobium taihuense]
MGMVGGRRLALLGSLMLASSLTEGVGLLLLVPITAIVAGEQAPSSMAMWLTPLAGLPVGLLLAAVTVLVGLRSLIVYLVLDQQARLGNALTRSIRIEAQGAVLSAEWRWLSAQSTSAHAAKLVGEADRVGGLGESMLSVATGVITLVMLLAAAFAISWQLTSLAVLAAAIVALVLIVMRSRRNSDGEYLAEVYEALHEQVSSGLFHFRAARISGAEPALAQQFGETARSVEDAQMRYHRSVAQAHVVFQTVAAAMLGGLIYLAFVVLHLPIGILVPVLAIMVRIVPVVTGLQGSLRRWSFNAPALSGLLDLVSEASVHREPVDDGGEPLHLKQSLDLKGVGLAYEGREKPVFRDFDLAIAAGSVVAICGPSGVGKSSLADMLGGLISPDTGQILIDGEPLEGAARIRWRRRVAYVEQVPYLFDGTIAQNLAWGQAEGDSNAIRAAMTNALERASAQFVFDLPAGLDTRVGEAGRQFSGGERQRLALARALLRKPELLILDEVTAALDGSNENAVMQTVRDLRGACTILILGHRTALLELADQIVDLGEHAGS